MKIHTSDLPQQVIDKMSPEDRKELGLMSTKDIRTSGEKNEEKLEKEIQTQIEKYLIQIGYERRTPADIARGRPRAGWFIHLHATKRNPIVLDLLILANSMPRQYLELELKTSAGKVREAQQTLVEQGASIARSAEEAIQIIQDWHRSLYWNAGVLNTPPDNRPER